MKFRATETPIDAAAPTKPPATASETEMIFARMIAVFTASRSTSVWLVTVLSAMYAFVLVRMTFVATAPAPLIPTAPPRTPTPTASDAAAAIAWIAVGAVTVSAVPSLRIR